MFGSLFSAGRLLPASIAIKASSDEGLGVEQEVKSLRENCGPPGTDAPSSVAEQEKKQNLVSQQPASLVFMAERTGYKAITRGIAVSVEPTYLEADSSPSASQYVWAYRVIIENQGRETVQLLSRHWMITNARGEFTEVKGLGVIGKQPFLKPGESHTYTSGAPLNTPTGMMGGSYLMESDSGERFDIEIPTFSLDSPNQKTMLQ